MLDADAGGRHLAREGLHTMNNGIADGEDIIVRPV